MPRFTPVRVVLFILFIVACGTVQDMVPRPWSSLVLLVVFLGGHGLLWLWGAADDREAARERAERVSRW